MTNIDYRKIAMAISGIVLVLAAFILPISTSAQDLSVTNIEISDMKNNSASISWRTSKAKTKGVVYVGEKQDALNRVFRYNTYSYNHQLSITGLEKNKDYFYKIIIIGSEGDERELFIRTFSTKRMIDTNKPEITELDVVQSCYQGTLLRWTTDEETSAVIAYGTKIDNLDKKSNYKSYSLKHELFLYGLEEDKKYYIKVIASDRDKNEDSYLISTTAYGSKSQASLSISNIEPISFDDELISARTATIKFRTNMASKAQVLYGTNSSKLKGSVTNDDLHTQKHEITIENLEPLTTYFFKIKAYDSFYKKSVVTEVMSFRTGDMQMRFASGSLIRDTSDNKIYIIDGETKAWIESPEVFLGLGFKSEWVRNVSHSILEDYKEVGSVSSYSKHPNGSLIKYAYSATIYLVQGGRKCPIGSAAVFVRNRLDWDKVITISSKEKYKTGNYVS